MLSVLKVHFNENPGTLEARALCIHSIPCYISTKMHSVVKIEWCCTGNSDLAYACVKVSLNCDLC